MIRLPFLRRKPKPSPIVWRIAPYTQGPKPLTEDDLKRAIKRLRP